MVWGQSICLSPRVQHSLAPAPIAEAIVYVDKIRVLFWRFVIFFILGKGCDPGRRKRQPHVSQIPTFFYYYYTSYENNFLLLKVNE